MNVSSNRKTAAHTLPQIPLHSCFQSLDACTCSCIGSAMHLRISLDVALSSEFRNEDLLRQNLVLSLGGYSNHQTTAYLVLIRGRKSYLEISQMSLGSRSCRCTPSFFKVPFLFSVQPTTSSLFTLHEIKKSSSSAFCWFEKALNSGQRVADADHLYPFLGVRLGSNFEKPRTRLLQGNFQQIARALSFDIS